MAETKNPNEFYCGICKHNVYICETQDQVDWHTENKHCLGYMPRQLAYNSNFITFIGAPQTGKTSLLKRIENGFMPKSVQDAKKGEQNIESPCASNGKGFINVKAKKFGVDIETSMYLKEFSIEQAKQSKHMNELDLDDGRMCCLVFSFDDPMSLEMLINEYDHIKDLSPNLIIGTKKDLVDAQKEKKIMESVEKLKNKCPVSFVACSAQTGEKVKNIIIFAQKRLEKVNNKRIMKGKRIK